MNKEINKNNKLSHTLWAEIFPGKPTKGQRRQMQIIEGAIKNYALKGVEKTTFEAIANTCKVSRPLVMRYFPDREELFMKAVQYIRANFQAIAVNALESEPTLEGKLRAYIRSTFYWEKQYPYHATTWMLMYYYCGINKEIKKLNTELVNMGHDRITALVDGGKRSGCFRCGDPVQVARRIQVIITGALLSAHTEKQDVKRSVFVESIVDLCLSLVKA